MADFLSSGASKRREERMNKEIRLDEEISVKAYNGVIGCVLIYGLLVNVLMCYIFQDRVLYMKPGLLIAIQFIGCIVGSVMSSNSDNPIISFIGYNFVVIPMGLVVSACVALYGGLGSEVVGQAFAITMLTTATMAAFSFAKPEWFERLGNVLFVGLFGLFIAEMVLIFVGADQLISSWIAAVLFSLYIGYDFYRAQQFPKTLDNAVDSALDVYMDVIILFLRILRILGSKGGGSKGRR